MSPSISHVNKLYKFKPMEDKFSWTQEYKISWEEEAGGPATENYTIPRRTSTTRKNIIRHLHVVIDTSSSIEKLDYLPSVRSAITRLLSAFSERFTVINPLSTLSFMLCADSFHKYSRSLDIVGMFSTVGSGDFSFLNCLKSSIAILKPSNYTRECLIITASVGTKDTSSYQEVCKELKKYNIRISIISICGEVTLFRKICGLTNGTYVVPLDVNHFELLLNDFSIPLESSETTNSLVKFGFPNTTENPGLCGCHLSLHQNLYECPLCRAPVCSLPVDCPICGTRLVSPLNISRSYHHMYLAKAFIQGDGVCTCCKDNAKLECTDCNSKYCAVCGDFQQSDLGFCIFCK
ncbi:transcription initiation factor TFIIH subunit 2 [Pancytospora epiphaga]|nr:transcription initiation factor TFIIH subunit 2 [Pancytospora epiphaga]